MSHLVAVKPLVHQLEQDFERLPASMASSGLVARDVGQTKASQGLPFRRTRTGSKETDIEESTLSEFDHSQDVRSALEHTAGKLSLEHSKDWDRLVSDGSMALENVQSHQLEEPFDSSPPPSALKITDGEKEFTV